MRLRNKSFLFRSSFASFHYLCLCRAILHHRCRNRQVGRVFSFLTFTAQFVSNWRHWAHWIVNDDLHGFSTSKHLDIGYELKGQLRAFIEIFESITFTWGEAEDIAFCIMSLGRYWSFPNETTEWQEWKGTLVRLNKIGFDLLTEVVQLMSLDDPRNWADIGKQCDGNCKTWKMLPRHL